MLKNNNDEQESAESAPTKHIHDHNIKMTQDNSIKIARAHLALLESDPTFRTPAVMGLVYELNARISFEGRQRVKQNQREKLRRQKP